MADDKAERLRSLSIDRTGGGPPAGVSPAIMGVIAVVVAAAAGAGGWLVAGLSQPKPANIVAAPGASSGAAASIDASATPSAPSGPRVVGLIASGYVTARRQATVSAEITGRLVEVLVEEGAVVEERQVLARLDATRASIDLDLAKARVVSNQATADSIAAELADAERALKRSKSLNKSSFSSDADLSQAQARVESLAAQLRRARADIDIARLDAARQADYVDRHTVRAPFAGVVVAKNAQAGEIIAPGSAGGGFTRTGVATIVDMASLEVEVDVSEGQIERIKPGMRAQAVLDAYQDWKIPAKVIAIIPTANRDRATIQVRVGLDVRDARVLPDMAAKVTFLDERA